MTDPTTPRREVCVRCLRPKAVCLCGLVTPTAHETPVLVLQHPQEQRQAKNSVTLLRLSLARCEVVVGERFPPQTLSQLLHRPGYQVRLLYPDVFASPAPRAPVVPEAPGAPGARCGGDGLPIHLVVIDATWRKSLRMLLEHPLLATLPRLSLSSAGPTRYRAIRAARRADQLSTLEATVKALELLEGPAFDAEPLLDAFGRFIARLAAWQRTNPNGSGSSIVDND